MKRQEDCGGEVRRQRKCSLSAFGRVAACFSLREEEGSKAIHEGNRGPDATTFPTDQLHERGGIALGPKVYLITLE